ncbi:trimeric intracellular cation channel family protein [Shimazuella kribbensis]|uniref:trimeric intracellular cation channel family protein n=1 Tax=Shimazuella kribbensis TaxID=139808 RepID=UPI000417940D|nr:trimeric intracellular cation channel family protein [Shimazuella kribbensis]
MIWDIFSYIGIAAFAISGAMMAIEEEYDLFGVYVLGFITTFGGGVVRNILIGLPASLLWEQNIGIYTALIAITLTIITPTLWFHKWKRWLVFFDAIGLSAFSIQGALFAVDQHLSIHAVVVASTLTGIGGGLIRDILAGRKPLLLKEDVYAVWSMLSGFIIGLHTKITDIELFFLFILVIMLRMISVHYQLKLPLKIMKYK